MHEENNNVGDGIEVRHIAFCDILGFSNKIMSDFNRTLEVYKEFRKSMFEFRTKEVQATMYSDAILITAMSLGNALSAVQSLWFLALRLNLMIRGAVTKGRYWEERQGIEKSSSHHVSHPEIDGDTYRGCELESGS